MGFAFDTAGASPIPAPSGAPAEPQTPDLPAAAAVPSHTDHRGRLRDRFARGGANAMPDYELLELLLFRIIPRRDVKPLAKALLSRFGDLAGVLGAPVERLSETPGCGPAAALELKITHAVLARASQAVVRRAPILTSWSALLEYCRLELAHEPREQFRVLYLDAKNQLIRDELMGSGTVDHAPVYPREVLRRALELSASALILVHNHPSGDPKPSLADITMTREIVSAAKPLGLIVHDHLVIGRQGVASFKSLGLL
jgi:DNA repair protein RadC